MLQFLKKFLGGSRPPDPLAPSGEGFGALPLTPTPLAAFGGFDPARAFGAPPRHTTLRALAMSPPLFKQDLRPCTLAKLLVLKIDKILHKYSLYGYALMVKVT